MCTSSHIDELDERIHAALLDCCMGHAVRGILKLERFVLKITQHTSSDASCALSGGDVRYVRMLNHRRGDIRARASNPAYFQHISTRHSVQHRSRIVPAGIDEQLVIDCTWWLCLGFVSGCQPLTRAGPKEACRTYKSTSVTYYADGDHAAQRHNRSNVGEMSACRVGCP